MSILTVRFIGICCLIDKPGTNGNGNADRKGNGTTNVKTNGNGNGYSKRVVLPVDTRVRERLDGAHIPYIEVEVVDAPRITGRFADDRTYTRDVAAYRRFHLSGDRIAITNEAPAPGAGLNVLSTYTERVPSLTQVSTDVPSAPDPAVIGSLPDPQRVAGYFDITHGDLHAGPPNLFPTRFSEPTRWPTRRLAQWIELQIPIRDGEGPRIEVESFGRNLGTRVIQLSERTARITIGNQLKDDIERNTADAASLRREDFREHWRLYYDLFPRVPDGASRPERTATVPNGCVVSGHP